jgi:phage pi2 protein 07
MLMRRHGRAQLADVTKIGITRMSLNELIEYEALLWTWMEKITRSKIHCDDVIAQLNAIHREVEWRATQKDWDDAAHS